MGGHEFSCGAYTTMRGKATHFVLGGSTAALCGAKPHFHSESDITCEQCRKALRNLMSACIQIEESGVTR
jgi:hypothetical protein